MRSRGYLAHLTFATAGWIVLLVGMLLKENRQVMAAGFVLLSLGLVLGVVTAFRHRREVFGTENAETDEAEAARYYAEIHRNRIG